MSTGTVLLGVDLATADVRVVAVRPDGTVAANESGPLPEPQRPRPGWSEQQPRYADVTAEVLARVAARLDGAHIAGLAVTSTSGTIVPCTSDGVPAGLALLYDDRRAQPADGSPAPALDRVAWLVRHRPAARYLHVSDVVLAALAGTMLPTDTSHALKTGADPRTGTWRTDLLSRAGVDPTWLPALAAPGKTIGSVSPAAADRTGIPAGTPIVLGMTDGCAGQIAAGAVRPGDSVTVLGTTLVLKVVAANQVEDAAGGVYSHRAPDGLWWSVTDAAPASDVDAFRAVLEGVSFTERLGFEELARRGAPSSTTARSVGGGSRNATWLRIRATVTGRTIEVPHEPSSGFGAAVLAAAASTHPGLADAVAAMVRIDRTIHPDPAQQARLDDSYHRFIQLLRDRGWFRREAENQDGGR